MAANSYVLKNAIVVNEGRCVEADVAIAGGRIERVVVNRLRVAVGHFQGAGNAASHRRPGFRRDVALVLEAGLAEMHLVVDHAGQQPGAG